MVITQKDQIQIKGYLTLMTNYIQDAILIFEM